MLPVQEPGLVMAGVIDERGQQWEHCNACGDFVKLQDLQYEPKSESYPYGRDLCIRCHRRTQLRGDHETRINHQALPCASEVN